MTRKQKKELHRRQTTRQLMGIDQLTGHGVKTPQGELVFFLIRPDNLSVLSNEGVRSRVRSLTDLISGTDKVQILALDSRESFQKNKLWYQQRLERENNPKIRELLASDIQHLDEIQTTTASAREFALAYQLDRLGNENMEALLTRMEKDIREWGFHVRLAREQDVKRLLAVYYQQDVTTEYFEGFDGENAVRR